MYCSQNLAAAALNSKCARSEDGGDHGEGEEEESAEESAALHARPAPPQNPTPAVSVVAPASTPACALGRVRVEGHEKTRLPVRHRPLARPNARQETPGFFFFSHYARAAPAGITEGKEKGCVLSLRAPR